MYQIYQYDYDHGTSQCFYLPNLLLQTHKPKMVRPPLLSMGAAEPHSCSQSFQVLYHHCLGLRKGLLSIGFPLQFLIMLALFLLNTQPSHLKRLLVITSSSLFIVNIVNRYYIRIDIDFSLSSLLFIPPRLSDSYVGPTIFLSTLFSNFISFLSEDFFGRNQTSDTQGIIRCNYCLYIQIFVFSQKFATWQFVQAPITSESMH